MDTTALRRELARSARLLVTGERWLWAGLVGGAVGYLIWLAGTGVAVSQVATAAGAPWSTETALLAATFGVLWVLAPALVAVRYVVGNLTNLRGNVGQAYRFDRPLLLLVPPLALAAVAVGVGVAGAVPVGYALVGLGVANALLLVRTVAYGYRVYSLSSPRLVQALALVAAVVAAVAVVSRTGGLTGQTALVDAVVDRYGVGPLVTGDLSRAGVTVPTLPLVAAATPGVLAVGYVCLQLSAALVVRVRQPDVPRSSIRAGQRYPSVVRPDTDDGLATDAASDTDGSADGAIGDGEDRGSDEPGGSEGTAGDPLAGDADGGSGGSPEGEDSFGQTRVFTPPDDADLDDATDGGRGVKNELCPICGETYAADAGHDNCPNCNAVLDSG